jgi:hypothetical protein
MKPYVFSEKKPATKPQFSRKRNRHCIRKRKSNRYCIRKRKSRHKRQIIERNGEGAMKPNAFNPKTAPKRPFSR